MRKLLIATTNPGKLQELSDFLSDLPYELVSLSDIGITEDVEEDGETYDENSKKKALFYSRKSGLPAIADDGGLEIAALNGEPGVRSRRWLGFDASDEELIDHMKKIAKSLPDHNRRAVFKTVVSLAFPDGKVFSEMGEIKGSIPKIPFKRKMKGYPYRSFFFLPEIGKYYFESELTDKEMKRFNHRRRAVEKIKKILKKRI